MSTRYEAGATLSAAEALRQSRQTFTAEQVAHLTAMAFESGRNERAREDLIELWGTWQDHVFVRASYEDMVAGRVAEMAALAKTPEYRGGPVEWAPGWAE